MADVLTHVWLQDTLERLAQSVVDRMGKFTLWEWEYTQWVTLQLAEQMLILPAFSLVAVFIFYRYISGVMPTSIELVLAFINLVLMLSVTEGFRRAFTLMLRFRKRE
jgi:hypothetical protein